MTPGAPGAGRVGAAPLLEVCDLRVVFGGLGEPPVTAVDEVSFTVEAGQSVALVGESGSGKSVTGLAIAGLLPPRGNRVSGQVHFDGVDLLTLSDAAMRERRGRDLGMVFPDPLSALNPVLPIGLQVAEVLRRHRGQDRAQSRRGARELLDAVGIGDADRRLREYPHQISGGMRQRVLIAIALACRPRLLIADEPTTALDVTIQAQILALLRELVQQSGTALILISHDLGVVAETCDTVHVLYAGKVVGAGPCQRLLTQPRHPYPHALLGCIPRLDPPLLDPPLLDRPRRGSGHRLPLAAIRGSIADAIAWEQGCAFAPRCERVVDACLAGTPALVVHDDHALRCTNPMPTDPPC